MKWSNKINYLLYLIEYITNPRCKVKYFFVDTEEEANNIVNNFPDDDIVSILKFLHHKHIKKKVVWARVKDDKGRYVVFMAKDKKYISEVLDLFNRMDTKSIRRLGNLFGYPKCCVDRYIKDRKNGINPHDRYLKQVKEMGLPYHEENGTCWTYPLLKVEDGVYSPFHIPCSPLCNETNRRVALVLYVSPIVSEYLAYLENKEVER
ncbi:MAG: DUF483 domain-containing protein [Thermoplasmata archaeon]|nr:DUF483 domain-containing protein [Thermoplasmata archaeon]